MRLSFLCALIPFLAACAADSEFRLETSYDLRLTLEEEVCDGTVQPSMHEVDGTLTTAAGAASDAFDLAFEIFVIPEASIRFQLLNVTFKKDGSFESWTSEAFDRGGEIFVPFFHFMQGSATTEGFDARYTVYMSDEPSDQSVPVCRYVWQVHNR